MVTSQNGYDVIQSSGDSRLHKWRVTDDRHFLARRGSVGFNLVHFALFFHDEIERLDLGVWDEWGWASRPIRDSSEMSNHSSGTALDLNATRHPLGVSALATFTPVQLARMRKALSTRYDDCLRHGAFYLNRPDGMHVESDRPLHDQETLARRLLHTKRGKEILALNPGQKAVILS